MPLSTLSSPSFENSQQLSDIPFLPQGIPFQHSSAKLVVPLGLPSPTLSNSTYSTSPSLSSSSSSPISYMDNNSYSISSAQEAQDLNSTSAALMAPHNIYMYPITHNEPPSILSHGMDMQSFIPMDYTTIQQHQHHVPSDHNIVSSTLEIIPSNLGYMTYNRPQSQPAPQLDYSTATSRYPFNMPMPPQSNALETPQENLRDIEKKLEQDNTNNKMGLHSQILPDKDKTAFSSQASALDPTLNRRQSSNEAIPSTSNENENGNEFETGTGTAPIKRKRLARRRLTKTQKIAHNKIEKRYRTNINEKIFGLLDMISPTWKEPDNLEDDPDVDVNLSGNTSTGNSSNKSKIKSNRSSSPGEGEYSSGEGEDDEQSKQKSRSSVSAKQNKSNILERAAAYIKYLHSSNKELRHRNAELSKLLNESSTNY